MSCPEGSKYSLEDGFAGKSLILAAFSQVHAGVGPEAVYAMGARFGIGAPRVYFRYNAVVANKLKMNTKQSIIGLM